MAFEWKLAPRPYSDAEAKELLKNVVSPETTDWHYNTHQKGYVTGLNNIEKGLETADPAGANGNYSQIGELKRRFTWNHAGALLHEIYWDVLGGDGDAAKESYAVLKDFQANPEKYVQKGAAEVRTTVKDLVCGMDVDPRASSTLKTQYKGKAYYFCSEHCKTGFETNPESYVQKQVPGLEPHISGMME